MISFDTPVDQQFPVYSRAHTAVVLPGVVSPLAWSLLGPALEEAHRVTFCERLGLMARPKGKAFLFVGRFAGRLYQNVSVLAAIAARGPSPSPLAAEIGLDGADISQYQRRWSDRLWTLLSLARGGLAFTRLDAWTRDGLRSVESLKAATDETLRGEDAPAIAAHLWSAHRGLARLLALNGTVRSFEMAAVATVDALVARHHGDAEIVAGLVSGMPGIESSQPSLRLHALARWSASRPDVAAALRSGESFSALRAGASPSIASFCDHFEAFLVDHGHRGVTETDPTVPAWVQQPDAVLSLVRALLDDTERDIDARLAERRQHAREFVAGLPRHERAVVRAVVTVARRLITRAEVTKSAAVRHIHQMRRCVFALRDLLSTAIGPADLTLLTIEELMAIAAGGTTDTRNLTHRRGELERAADLDVPLVFEHSFAPDVAGVGPVSDLLVGLGASPGSASGFAVVVTNPTDPLPAGSVLVAQATDTPWIPLFLTATAVVTDLGSFMSHSSIVARELGIPAVVNTRSATRTIKTGQRTHVDGDRGVVLVGHPRPE